MRIDIENGSTGTLKVGTAEHHVGVRPRGDRFELAYQGSAPRSIPCDATLDEVEVRVVERLKSANGWVVLNVAPR